MASSRRRRNAAPSGCAQIGHYMGLLIANMAITGITYSVIAEPSSGEKGSMAGGVVAATVLALAVNTGVSYLFAGKARAYVQKWMLAVLVCFAVFMAISWGQTLIMPKGPNATPVALLVGLISGAVFGLNWKAPATASGASDEDSKEYRTGRDSVADDRGLDDDDSGGRFPTRAITATGFDSVSVPPLSYPQGESPRVYIARAAFQIEQEIERSGRADTFRAVKVRTPLCRTLMHDEVEEDLPREFYTLGLEAAGRYCLVAATLHFKDKGTMATVTVDSKEILSPSRNFVPWLLSAMYPTQAKGDKDSGVTPTGPLFGVILCVMIAGMLGAAAGPFGVVIMGVGSFFALRLAANSMKTHRNRERNELLTLVRSEVMGIYNRVDIKRPTVQKASQPQRPPRPSQQTTQATPQKETVKRKRID